MRISDWSSDVCSSDLVDEHVLERRFELRNLRGRGFLQMRAENDLGDVGRVEVRNDLGIDHLVEAGLVRLIMSDGLGDRTSGVSGKSVSVRVDLGGRVIIKKKTTNSRKKDRIKK